MKNQFSTTSALPIFNDMNDVTIRTINNIISFFFIVIIVVSLVIFPSLSKGADQFTEIPSPDSEDGDSEAPDQIRQPTDAAMRAASALQGPDPVGELLLFCGEAECIRIFFSEFILFKSEEIRILADESNRIDRR